MKTIVNRRNYKTLIIFIVFTLLFLFIRQNLAVNIEILYGKWTTISSDKEQLPWSELQKLIVPYMDKIRDIEFNYGLLILVSTVVNYIYLASRLKKITSLKILLFFTFLVLFAIAIEGAEGMRMSIKEDDENFISLLVFLPYLYFIYIETIIGVKVDITEDIKNKAIIKHDDNINDLNKLLEMELISQEEYNKKKELRSQEKIRIEIKDTEEYSLLLKAKQKGLLTEEEFNKKVEMLVNKKITEV